MEVECIEGGDRAIYTQTRGRRSEIPIVGAQDVSSPYLSFSAFPRGMLNTSFAHTWGTFGFELECVNDRSDTAIVRLDEVRRLGSTNARPEIDHWFLLARLGCLLDVSVAVTRSLCCGPRHMYISAVSQANCKLE